MMSGLFGASAALILAGGAVADQPIARYQCADGTRLVATFHNASSGPGSVSLFMSKTGKHIELPQGMSADGGRYGAGNVKFWIKGRTATFSRARHVTTCKANS